MSTHESKKADYTADRPMYWFSGKSLDAILAEAAEIRGQPNARMEIQPCSNGGVFVQFFADGYDGPAINESHICPIDCPS